MRDRDGPRPSISKIEEAILSRLENTPPELSADIYKTGIYLAGGGALLRGLDKRISSKTRLPVHVAEEPLRRGPGDGDCPEERRQLRLPDARVSPDCRCATSGFSSNATPFS